MSVAVSMYVWYLSPHCRFISTCKQRQWPYNCYKIHFIFVSDNSYTSWVLIILKSTSYKCSNYFQDWPPNSIYSLNHYKMCLINIYNIPKMSLQAFLTETDAEQIKIQMYSDSMAFLSHLTVMLNRSGEDLFSRSLYTSSLYH